MPFQTKSSVLAVVEETTEGTLIDPSLATHFTVLREGFSVEGATETIQSDELINDIGASKAFVSRESPTSSIPKYFKHSGVEGQKPDYSIMIESLLGEVTEFATEYAVIAGSSAGDASNRAFLQLNTGDAVAGAFVAGQAVLIKHASFPYEIANIYSVDTGTDRLYLAFNLQNAPASGTNLGKAVFYQAKGTGHPTYSVHHFQASDTSSGFKQAIAGCRTTSMTANFPATELATVEFGIDGIKYYFDPIRITASTKYIDFTDDSGTVAAILDEGVYDHPEELAAHIAARMTAVSTNTINCTYTGSKFVISSDGTIFSLLWNTGTNAANTAGGTLGFSVAADDTGATSYTADNVQTWEAPVTPTYDAQSPLVVKGNEFFVGTFDKNFCRDGSNVSMTITGDKTDDLSYCAGSGISGSILSGRAVEISATFTFKKDEIDLFNAVQRNSDVAAQWVHGPKSAGNWIPGQCVNLYIASGSVTTNIISDSDGLVVAEMTITGHVASATKDIAINLV